MRYLHLNEDGAKRQNASQHDNDTRLHEPIANTLSCQYKWQGV